VVRHLIFLILGVILLSNSAFAQSDKIIFKLKNEYRWKSQKSNTSVPSIQEFIEGEGLHIEKVFPNHSPMSQKNLEQGMVDISSIYKLKIPPSSDKGKILLQLKKDPHIAYAEEEVVNHLTYQANDTLNYTQWYLSAVRIFEAWDIEQGDTNVFIAITDTGTDTDHEDLQKDLYKNLDDPINGIDDDADGYIDNYYGWDVAMNDNDVNPETHAGANHGTNVAGIASASTDNTTGISGCGFNTRIMTVKIDNPNGILVGAYSSIVYAADQGASIINCSWGSYNYSDFGRDIVNYASINRGALVICGAGNGPFNTPDPDGIEDRFYPAAYENAIAVGAIDTGDIVKRSSNFGYWLDIFAPGERMWTTYAGDNYGRNGGTSMASPVIAAAAALIKSQKPGYSNRQIEERLINSAINIEASNDPKYVGKMGPGRVDFLNALADTNKPGIRFEKIAFGKDPEEFILSGDSLFISGEFANYLKNASSGTAKLTELTNSTTTTKNQISLPAINSLDRYNSTNDPFIFIINSQIDLNTRLEFKLEITAGSYSKTQFFSLVVNNRFVNLSNGTILMTLGNQGEIGYPDLDNRSIFSGFSYKFPSSHLWESSFMVGNSSTYVADAFRGNAGNVKDFSSIDYLVKRSDARAFESASGSFDDSQLNPNPRIKIDQNTYLYDDTYSENLAVFNYVITNTSGTSLNALYAGMIADWDIINYANNKIFYDSSRKMGVSFSTDSSLYIGMQVLSHPELTNHYALDNTNGGEGGVDPTGGFSTAEKFQVLSSSRDSAGFHRSTGEDIIDAISIGPFDLAKDSSISLSYAYLVADNYTELLAAADSALSIYNNLPIGLDEQRSKADLRIFPNPATDQINLFLEGTSEALVVQIYDLNARLVLEDQIAAQASRARLISLDLPSLKSGVYLIKIIGPKTNIQDKFVLSPNN